VIIVNICSYVVVPICLWVVTRRILGYMDVIDNRFKAMHLILMIQVGFRRIGRGSLSPLAERFRH
jgi:hypothetical protein